MSNITIQSITDKFFLSREYLSRLYKNETNYTISRKITEVRIKEAKKFLLDTTMTVI